MVVSGYYQFGARYKFVRFTWFIQMKNHVFQQPTRVIFGRGLIIRVGQEVASIGHRVLLVSGQDSLKRLGIYQRIKASLLESGIELSEIAGVRPNPELFTIRKGINLVRTEKIEVIIAAGGGSVLDSAKAIAAGALVDHDVWGFFKGKKSIRAALPVVAVPTAAGSGSEVNGGMVLTNRETRQKIGIGNRYLIPATVILDPETTFSVPPSTTAFGAVDAFCHLLEFYLNREESFSPVQDHYSAGLMRTITEACETALVRPDHYQSRAELMWASALAMNGLAASGLGRVGFPLHLIEHSLSALHDIPHGAGLAALIPGFLAQTARKNPERLARFAWQVFGICSAPTKDMAFEGITQIEAWLKRIGTPTSLAELGLCSDDIPELAANTVAQSRLWRLKEYGQGVVEEILYQCLEQQNFPLAPNTRSAQRSGSR